MVWIHEHDDLCDFEYVMKAGQDCQTWKIQTYWHFLMDWQATDAVLLFQPDRALRPHLIYGPSWLHSTPWCRRETHIRSSKSSFSFQTETHLFPVYILNALFSLFCHNFQKDSPEASSDRFCSKIKISATLVSDTKPIFKNAFVKFYILFVKFYIFSKSYTSYISIFLFCFVCQFPFFRRDCDAVNDCLHEHGDLY